MRKDREIAIELRKAGKSYKEIHEALKIPRGTLSGWFSKEEWSEDLREKLTQAARTGSSSHMHSLNQVRGGHLAKAYEAAAKEAGKEFEVLRYHPLFIAGMMLYWSGGDRKTKNLTRLTSANPELIKLFVLFLKEACGIPEGKIKASLQIYLALDTTSSIRFWSFASSLPVGQFTKSSLIKSTKQPIGLQYGVCTVVVSSTYFKKKMLEWLKLLPKELMNREYYENISK